MEYEVRFYKPFEEIEGVIKKLNSIRELKKSDRTYEKTIQYNHCDPKFDFYTKEVDGRFRIRVSKNNNSSKCKVSWKRRLPSTIFGLVNAEEEKELTIKIEEYENLIFIIENVMNFKIVESYERYRTTYSNDEVEIAVDEYPFGVALEIESKTEENPAQIINYWVGTLGLNIDDSYRLSWDDKYQELCKAQNIECFSEVTFEKPMPEIK